MSKIKTDIWTIEKSNSTFIVRIDNGADISGKSMSILFSELEKKCGGKNYGVIYDCTDLELGHLSKSAYMENKSLDLSPHRRAEAFVINSLPIRMIVNFYHKIFRPPFPSASFKSLKEALEWIKKNDE